MMYGQSIQACFLLYMWWIVSLQSKIYNCHIIQYARQTAVRLFKQLIPSYGSIILLNLQQFPPEGIIFN